MFVRRMAYVGFDHEIHQTTHTDPGRPALEWRGPDAVERSRRERDPGPPDRAPSSTQRKCRQGRSRPSASQDRGGWSEVVRLLGSAPHVSARSTAVRTGLGDALLRVRTCRRVRSCARFRRAPGRPNPPRRSLTRQMRQARALRQPLGRLCPAARRRRARG